MATWFDLSPRTTLPFQRVKAVKRIRRVRYGRRVDRARLKFVRVTRARDIALRR